MLSTISAINEHDLIDKQLQRMTKTLPAVPQYLNKLSFRRVMTEFPTLIYKFVDSDITAEISIREMQIGTGVQPMLYVCVPISELEGMGAKPLVGRSTKPKERATFVLNADNAHVVVDLINIFGMLSPRHRQDMVSIISTTIGVT